MIRGKCAADLAPWLDRARNSLVASFAAGVLRDQVAIRMAIALPWSNGQTEGQITRCTAAESSTCSKHVSSVPCETDNTKIASEPLNDPRKAG